MNKYWKFQGKIISLSSFFSAPKKGYNLRTFGPQRKFAKKRWALKVLMRNCSWGKTQKTMINNLFPGFQHLCDVANLFGTLLSMFGMLLIFAKLMTAIQLTSFCHRNDIMEYSHKMDTEVVWYIQCVKATVNGDFAKSWCSFQYNRDAISFPTIGSRW
jgi:hypothetical protein